MGWATPARPRVRHREPPRLWGRSLAALLPGPAVGLIHAGREWQHPRKNQPRLAAPALQRARSAPADRTGGDGPGVRASRRLSPAGRSLVVLDWHLS